jgi:ferrochelatase
MIGVLFINLGTPAAPTTVEVRKYLREFLMDPRVLDMPFISRWLLVHLVIAPFRAPRSASAYQKIWTEAGSPLLCNTRNFAAAVARSLGNEFVVEVAMRYGEPSIPQALDRLIKTGVDAVRVMPLYPQYASSSTGSSEEAVLRYERKKEHVPPIQFVPPFFDHPDFLKSFAEIGAPRLKEFQPNHILFSFHGLPERHILKEDISGRHCLKSPDCCERIIPANGLCYRAHCVQSARGIARELGLKKDDYTIAFQSRLGRTPWIQPFTDFVLKDLARQKTKRVAVFCPSFVADCLETLEEIGIRGREQFIKDGGEDLLLIPSLNDHPSWVESVSNQIRGS